MTESLVDTREFEFTLIMSGPRELTQEVEDSLFNAGCSDATLSLQHGSLYLEFVREAESFEEAVFSAIENVREAKISAEVSLSE